MKGVFGEGASVVAVPDATRAANVQHTRAAQREAAEQRPVLTPEQLKRSAQSRGLWTDGGDVPTAPSSQPRAGTLPRAVVGTPSPASAANTNYRSPSIGALDPQASAPPSAAEMQPAAAAAPSGAQVAPQVDAKEQPSAAQPKAAEVARPEIIDKPAEQKPQPTAAKPAAPAPSSPNTTLLLALILIAAIVAVLFIGAAVGLWGLPWGKGSTGRSPLSKAIPAKSLPEMRAVAAAPAAPVPVAAAPAPAVEQQPTAAEPAAPTIAAEKGSAPAPAQPSAETTTVMEAEEAAPLRAPPISGPTLEEITDLASPEATQAIATARAALRAGRPKDAEAVLRPLLEKNPDDYHVAEVMAQALLARGAAVEAVGLAQRIVKKRPKRASYRVLLGDALRRAGDEPSAKLAYKEALALDPKMRQAQRRLKSRKLPPPPAPEPAPPPPSP
ncbi:MAG TPA: tetratricopeptide repeat protein [Polyangiales bacterium]|nr:tetratricopeptide repeat protein [Polyangiales bacterium]